MSCFENAIEVIYEKVNIPIEPDSEDYQRVQHSKNRKIGKLEGYYAASELRDYDPDFPVWGYFNLNDTEITEEVLAKAHDMGEYMLAGFMKAGGLNSDPSEAIARKIGGLFDLYESYKKQAEDIILLAEVKKIPCRFGGIWNNNV